MALKGQLILGNFWVAVGDSSNKDWMQIGTDPGSSFLWGQSHVASTYGYPTAWGDDAS